LNFTLKRTKIIQVMDQFTVNCGGKAIKTQIKIIECINRRVLNFVAMRSRYNLEYDMPAPPLEICWRIAPVCCSPRPCK
jgi:hypothetical protein